MQNTKLYVIFTDTCAHGGRVSKCGLQTIRQLRNLHVAKEVRTV